MKFLILIIVLEAAILLFAYRRFKEWHRRITEKSEARLRYIRILCELIYTYSHAPETLLNHLKAEITIKKLLSYHVVEDRCANYFSVRSRVNKKDQLLYMLHEEGFQPKELCVIFELNNLNSVYVKCCRINKKGNFDLAPEPADKI